jgi:NTE family protein
VLRGLVDLGLLPREHAGLDIVVGSSAGAINATALVAHADRFAEGLSRLERVWTEMQPQHVFRTDVASLGRIGVRWAWDLTFGGALRNVRAKSLLDTSPLRAMLGERIPFASVDANIAAGVVDALALVATDLHTSNGVVFLHGAEGVQTWSRRRWRVEPTRIRVEHLLASSAIPIFFPAVSVGGRWYGDGSIRNTTPLSPAINLGAERIVAIGVSGPSPREHEREARRAPTIARIAGVLLDAVMLDAIEVDVEHSERVNTSVVHCPTGDTAQPFRSVDVLWLRPSRQVRRLAAELADRIPPVVRYLLRGLGSDSAVTELASYLLFDQLFCGRLIELGERDVRAEYDRIAEFFAGGTRERARPVVPE